MHILLFTKPPIRINKYEIDGYITEGMADANNIMNTPAISCQAGTTYNGTECVTHLNNDGNSLLTVDIDTNNIPYNWYATTD